MIHHVTFPSRCGTLDHLSRPAFVECDYTTLPLNPTLVIPLNYQVGKLLLLGRCRKGNALGQFAVNQRIHHYELTCSFCDRDLRRTERPTCTQIHIYLYAQPVTLPDGIFQHLHPLRREEGDIVGIVALHAIQGCYLQRAYAVRGHLLHLPRKSFFRDS